MLHIRKFKHIRVYLGKIGTSFKKTDWINVNIMSQIKKLNSDLFLLNNNNNKIFIP